MSGSTIKQVNVYGVAEVDVAIDRSTFNCLGTTRDGVGITTDGYFIEVHNDENGGDAGPPVEIQYVGETAKIRVELTKYDPAVAATLEDHFSNSGTPGTPATTGTLMFAASTVQPSVGSGGACAIKIKCAGITPNIVRTYTLCVIRDAVEVNRGTKFSTFVLTFTAYKDPTSGKLWAEAAT